MKLYKNAKDVKEALLNGEEVVVNDWSANINDQDEVEIWDPKGSGVAASLMVLDKVVDDFMKMAQMPDKDKKPIKYPATEDPKKVLGPDSSEDKPWVDPKVNKQPPVQGEGSDTDLGADTSEDSPWSDPSVNDRPNPEVDQGFQMPETGLGPDTTQNPVEWEDKLTGPAEFRMAKALAVDEAQGPHRVCASLEKSDLGIFIIGSIVRRNGTELSKISDELQNVFGLHQDEAFWNQVTDLFMNSKAAQAALDWADELSQVPSSPEDLGEVFTPDVPEVGDIYEVLMSDNWGALTIDNIIKRHGGSMEGLEAMAQDFSEFFGQGEPVEFWQNVALHALEKSQESLDFADELKPSPGVGDLGEVFSPVGSIVDTFDQAPEPGRVYADYQELVKASPSEQILKDIADPDKWAANRQLEKLAEEKTPKEEEVFKNVKKQKQRDRTQVGEEAGAPGTGDGGDGGGASASCGKEAVRIKENWGDYSRDLEAESMEELYHGVRSLGQDEDYDWGRYRGVGPDDNMLPAEVVEDTNLMAEPVPTSPVSNPIEAAIKEAVDDTAKDYWTKYFGEYGEKLVTDDSGRPNRKDPHDVEVKEQPKPQNQQKVKEAQMAPGGGPQTEAPSTPEGQGDPAIPAPPGPGAPPPEAPQKAPGAGDEGLKALGWAPEDIQAMSPQDKENVLKIQLKKPGVGAPAGPAPGAPKAPTPLPPKDPSVAPQGGPVPLPVDQKPMVPGAPTAAREAREKEDALKVKKAFGMLTAQAPVETAPMPPAPNNPGAQPVQAPPTNPQAPAPVDPAAEFDPMAEDGISAELAAFDIYRQIQEENVSASSPNEVPVIKAQKLVQRLLSEVGMPVIEARSLFGLAKDQSFTKLFASLIKRERG
ncbi:hypothetical protein N8Z24_00045 [bacterium]|nr:hypothetical protein [bacterium]